MTLLQLFFTFFCIDLFAIGGGLVAISIMQQQIVDKGLLTLEEFYNMVAISESTPGAIGINMATYIGNELYGVLGGIIVSIATVLPSLIIIILVARFFEHFQDKPIVQAAFKGLRPAVSGMIVVSAWNIFSLAVLHLDTFKETKLLLDLFNFPAFIFYTISLFLLFKTKLHPVVIVLLGAVFGIVFL